MFEDSPLVVRRLLRRRRFCCFILLGKCVLLFTTVTYLTLLFSSEYHQLSKTEQASPKISEKKVKMKKILFWTRDNENSRNYGGIGLGKDGFRRAGCPVWQCESYDSEMEELEIPDEDFDAVLFHEPSWPYKHIPPKRSPHQLYVFWTMEPPTRQRPTLKWKKFNKFFNWTMTYRRDSEVFHPYGWSNKLATESSAVVSSGRALHVDKPTVNYAKGKTKMAAWFVSNCDEASSGRNELVQHLQKFIKVDVYGKCGEFSCPRTQDDYCRRMVN